MHVAFTEDQLLFRDTARQVLGDLAGPSVLRESWKSGAPTPRLWSSLAELGLLGMLAPEDAGGLGVDWIDAALIIEECGFVAAAEPAALAIGVAVPLLSGSAGAIAELLDGAIPAVVLRGESLVPHAQRAQIFIIETEGGWSLQRASDVAVEPKSSVDRTRALGSVTLHDGGLALVDAPSAAWGRAAALTATSLELLGLGRRMLEMATEYAKLRVQFGKPIGAQQAVKHMLANAKIALEFARPLVYRAALSLSAEATPDDLLALHASMAKAAAADATLEIGRTALQVHGAIGYSYEHDLHLFMKRAWCLAAQWGDAEFHRQRVAAALLDDASAPEWADY